LQGAVIHVGSIGTLELDSELLNLDQGFKTSGTRHHFKGCNKLNLEIDTLRGDLTYKKQQTIQKSKYKYMLNQLYSKSP